MTLRDDLLPTLWSVRSIPGQLGIRPHTVEVVKAVWRGAHTGDGQVYETVTAITESGGFPPKVRQLSSEELAVGALPAGTIEIGPITPDFPGGGTSLTTLGGSDLFDGNTFQLRITGPMHPDGAIYRVTKSSADRALHYTIQAQPVSAA